MEFSICIPSFEDLSLLKLCIKSIKKNSAYQHQICISCSDEDVIKYLKKDVDVDFIIINHDCGLSIGYNAAVSLAKNQYIIIADSDHVFSPNWDKNIIPFVAKDTITSLNRIETDSWGKHPDNFEFEMFNEEYIKYLEDKQENPKVFHPFIMSREVYNKIGGMNITFDLGSLHDDEFWYRLYKYEKVKFLYCYNSVVFHFSSPKRLSIIPRSKKEIQDNWGKRAPEVFKIIYGFDWIPAEKLYEMVK